MLLEKGSHSYTLSPTTALSNQHSPTSKPASTIMATEFAMPTHQLTSSPSQYSLYSHNPPNQPNNISPPTSSTATTPSPTSPRTVIPAHTRQLRPPKSPLYVPAVLRPTDPPRRAIRAQAQGPPTPPQSQHNSFDDLQGAKTTQRRDSGKAGLGAIYETEWASQGLGKVTGVPTRSHWKPDIQSPHCDYAPCIRPFSYFHRRHHCRRCGNIFCHEHSSYLIPLDQDANYHPRGTRVRACESCFHDFGRWAIGRTPSDSEDTRPEFTEPPTPTVSCPSGKFGAGLMGSVFGQSQNQKGAGGESMAQSVPRDWNWSTF